MPWHHSTMSRHEALDWVINAGAQVLFPWWSGTDKELAKAVHACPAQEIALCPDATLGGPCPGHPTEAEIAEGLARFRQVLAVIAYAGQFCPLCREPYPCRFRPGPRKGFLKKCIRRVDPPDPVFDIIREMGQA